MGTRFEDLASEQLTDNSKIISFKQCKTCKYRLNKHDPDWDYYGFQKVHCLMYRQEDNSFKPQDMNLDENDPDFMKCALFVEEV